MLTPQSETHIGGLRVPIPEVTVPEPQIYVNSGCLASISLRGP
jgi:hypothetical protein